MSKLKTIKDKIEILEKCIDHYNNKSYVKVIEILENMEKDFSIDDDPYLLGHVYGLLCNSYMESNPEAIDKIVEYSNKILLISTENLFEFTGNYSVYTKDKITSLLDIYQMASYKRVKNAFWGKARLLLFLKKYDEINILLERALALEKTNCFTYLIYGQLLAYKFEYDEAIKKYKEALKFASDSEKLYVYLLTSFVYRKKCDYKNAIYCLNEALKKIGEYSLLYYHLSLLYYSRKDKKWEKYLKQAIELSPCNTKYIVTMGNFISALSMTENYYNHAITINPYCTLGIIYKAYMSNDKEGCKLFKKAIRLNKYNPRGYVFYIVKMFRSNIINSKRFYLSIINLLKKYCIEIDYEIIFLNWFIENYDYPILQNIDNILELYTFNTKFHLLISEIYKNQRDYYKAKEILQKFSEINKYDPDVYYKMGLLDQDLGDYESALSNFQKSQELEDSLNIQIEIFLTDCDSKIANKKTKNPLFIRDVEEKLNKFLDIKKDLSPTEKFCLGEIAYNLGFEDLAISFFENIKNNTLQYSISCVYCYVIYKKRNEQEKMQNCLDHFSKGKIGKRITTLSEFIDFINDYISIKVLKTFYMNNKSYIDIDYNKIISKESDRNNDNLRELWFWISTIRSLLCYKKFNPETNAISHYTTTDTLDAICLYKDNNALPEKNSDKNFNGKIRLTTITPANDPEEGKILNKLLNSMCLSYIPEDNKIKNFAVLQTSLTLCEDSLTMFRFYGKKDFIEGTGVNIVFKDSYFRDDVKSVFTPYDKSSYGIKSKVGMNSDDNKETKEVDKKCLYWILYYDAKKNYLIFNPISKYQSQIIDLNNKPKKWYLLKEPCKNNMSKELAVYYQHIANNINYAIHELIDCISKIQKTNDSRQIELMNDLLFDIKFLFKDEAFSDEQELRLMSISEMGNSNIEIARNKLYENYIPVSQYGYNYIKKIVFGPNIEDCNIMLEYYKHIAALSHKDIEFEKSHAPFSITNNQGVTKKE